MICFSIELNLFFFLIPVVMSIFSLQSLASMTSTQVKVNRALSVPPVAFDLPLAANHRASATIAPPSAHIGIAPIQMRLISYDLREGQVPRFNSPLLILWRRFSGFQMIVWFGSYIMVCLFWGEKHNVQGNTLLKSQSERLNFYIENGISQIAHPTCWNPVSSLRGWESWLGWSL